MNQTETIEIPATLHLAKGSHTSPEAGMCLLEALAHLRSQPFSDHPSCVASPIGAYGRALNDALDDEKRQRLIAYIPQMVNTAGDPDRDLRRSYLSLDWLLRHWLPAWLDLAGLTTRAEEIRNAVPVRTAADCERILPIVDVARREAAAAGAAAWAAAGAAARDAAWSAAWAAAWDDAGAAAGDDAGAAAGAAAGDAAWAAAGAAAGAAARDAAGENLRPTLDQLQDDAIEFFGALIACP